MKKWIKISIIAVIALALFGIYYFKNHGNDISKGKGSEKALAWENYNPDDDKDKKIPMLLELGSPTCPACRRMEPTLEDFRKKYGDNVIVKKINIESGDNYALAKKYNVRLMPTFIFLDENSDLKGRYEGMLTLESIEKVFNSMGVKANE
ncbi:thioredoxin family protein [Clostridium sp. MSJ-4]|uniref:Thioredoxin family protein n=1 Tax=Clostridium simiarum TaxID=2841506 RepID=A0ABS6F1N9_9CLOT|nr:thioredoxin family protein [Clostridium simiarum]MBU5592158.1 thioredoxin family protein [Clostridium simiarum]